MLINCLKGILKLKAVANKQWGLKNLSTCDTIKVTSEVEYGENTEKSLFAIRAYCSYV